MQRLHLLQQHPHLPTGASIRGFGEVTPEVPPASLQYLHIAVNHLSSHVDGIQDAQRRPMLQSLLLVDALPFRYQLAKIL